VIVGDKDIDYVVITGLLEYFDKSEDCIALARAEEIGASRTMLKFAKKILDETRKSLETLPEENSIDISRDWRVKLGMIRMAKIMLSLPDEARSAIEAVDESPDTEA